MSFVGSANTGAIFAFDPQGSGNIVQSPYIQNCTNFIPNSTGLRIDGNLAEGNLKSMLLDSYTQYNQGGIGASITNNGYAQLVSMFTICNDIAVYCGSGGGYTSGKSGGSGVVILRYSDTFAAAASTTGSPTVTTSGGYRIYTFNGSGSITF